jgi:hypothetical protein
MLKHMINNEDAAEAGLRVNSVKIDEMVLRYIQYSIPVSIAVIVALGILFAA